MAAPWGVPPVMTKTVGGFPGGEAHFLKFSDHRLQAVRFLVAQVGHAGNRRLAWGEGGHHR